MLGLGATFSERRIGPRILRIYRTVLFPLPCRGGFFGNTTPRNLLASATGCSFDRRRRHSISPPYLGDWDVGFSLEFPPVLLAVLGFCAGLSFRLFLVAE